jgi:DNA-directed RNA polymerase subunit M/transcription elongation factor TFIIS
LKKLVKVCPACKKEYETTETCVLRKFYGAELIKNEKVLSEVKEQVVEDPASVKVKVHEGCEKCHTNEAVLVMSQHNFLKSTGRLIRILVCTSCKHKWIK